MLAKEVIIIRKHVTEPLLKLLRIAPCLNIPVCGFLQILL